MIAAAATWIVLVQRRLSSRRLRRLLALVLAVDLVVFNAFVIRPPTTEAKAQAHGPMSASLQAHTGNGRFIIYDPDQFETGQLYAMGQTDLNIFAGAAQRPGLHGADRRRLLRPHRRPLPGGPRSVHPGRRHLGPAQRLHPAVPAGLLRHPAPVPRPGADGSLCRRRPFPGQHRRLQLLAHPGGHFPRPHRRSPASAVRMKMRVAGSSRTIEHAAENPSSPGMRRSINMTSAR